ncbi:MAG: hypothetical protein IKG87_02820 [Clostridia bacterium]|nr:hypothetical protein [Clostridia bacterium]
MPSVWSGVDSNFPSFKENEPAKSKISKIVNYIFVLTEQLKYTLANLDTTNFNTKGLEDITDETAAQILEDLETLENRVNNLAVIVSAMNGRITTVEGYSSRIAANEASITDLTTRLGNMETSLNNLITAMSGMIELITASGSTVNIGGTGKTVNLLGTVNVNGTPI